ncbi:MAG: ABC transporter ATP-binding protein [Hungatella sp.]|nr:ABC transporter ATP-binding protein [Hungatella sp.]
MLVATGIYKCYHKKEILNGTELTAGPGECVGIIGGNGCGKTTLLSILAGAVRADRGNVTLDGKDLRKDTRAYVKKVAYVPQENPLMEELTVKDNLLLWYGGRRKELERDLESGAGAFLGIKPMLGDTVEKLSGGMKKRLSIACALANHGSVLILDEPGAALDMECKAHIRRYLKTYTGEGGTVVITSHETGELSACTRLCALKDGKLIPVEKELSEEALIKYL